ncbi:MAG TPA: hypothetical protein VN088_07305 [Nocardioides sp.]|nr:hypothetical protein [Nocardioides sp.]
MSHRLALAVSAAALVTAAATPALASGHPAPARTGAAHQRFAITFVTINGKDRPIRVVAAGPVSGRGTMTQRIVKQTATGGVLLATVTLPDGSVKLRVNDSDTSTVDLHSCTGRQSGKGTWRIVSGSGAYRNASGSGTFVRRVFIVGAFDRHAKCLGQSAPPVAETGTVVADGTAAR